MNRSVPAHSSVSTWRRCVATVCALAFLVFGFLHTMHHHAVAASGAPEIVVSLDTQPDPDKADVSGHCHACVMVAMLGLQAAIALRDQPAEVPATTPKGMRPHPPAAETPPPILSI